MPRFDHLLLKRALPAIIVFCTVANALAQTLPAAAAHMKVHRIDQTWRFNQDATTLLEATMEREALSDQGAIMIGKASKAYNSELEKFEMLEAYTLKADGRKIAVGQDGLQIQQGIAASGSNASWPGVEISMITFPDVQKGDRTVSKYRVTSSRPQLPGWAMFMDWLPPAVTMENVNVRIEAPRSLQLGVFASGMGLVKSQAADQEIWTASARVEPSALDNNAINLARTYPRIFATTIKDHGQLASLYARQAQSKAAQTDEVLQLASQITQDVSTPADKAKAVFDWVRKNIRYVAVYLGAGGYQPHDTAWILKNRYGDCKDHVLLMQALLKAVDVESVPALINTTAEYESPEMPVGYNHVIAYLPALDMFADPTDSRTPFGALPWSDSDKPVAVALAQGGMLMRTPAFSAQGNRILVKSVFRIDAKGMAQGTLSVDAQGYAATNVQNRLDQIPKGMGADAVKNMLESSRLRGRGTLQYPPVQRDVLSQSFKAELHIDNLLNDPRSGSINPHPALNLPIYTLSNMGNYAADKRSYAYACTPNAVREEFELQFDKAYKILRVPDNLNISHPDGVQFEAQYIRVDEPEGTTIKGFRQLTLSHPRHACSPQDYDTRRPVLTRIVRNLRSGVLFEQP
jgi:transglutaminase-like putative cysteine protease